jgi:hypothetical protein
MQKLMSYCPEALKINEKLYGFGSRIIFLHYSMIRLSPNSKLE